MKASVVTKISSWAAGLLAFICALVPFHAFLTVWAGDSFGHYTAWRLWAEVLLVPLTGWALYLLFREKEIYRAVRWSPLTWCIAAYVLVHLVLGAWALARHQVTAVALADGLVLNLRLPLFFFVAQTLAAQSDWLRLHWRKIVLIPAAIVVLFGLLQTFVLPADFLRHFGYNTHTIAPYETVDQKLEFVRTQSTLRGANPLGAYLAIVLATIAAAGWRWRKPWAKCLLAASLAATLIVLTYTYSRSAYIGAAIALAAAVWWALGQPRLKRIALTGLAAMVIVAAGLALTLRHNDNFQNTFFHTDEHSQSQRSSNQARRTALQNGLSNLGHQPLGAGPGSAGPASAHNHHPPRIAENYFLQIGQETGWLGLSLFIVINLLIAKHLWRQRNVPFARMLLASLLGITVINLLSHAWTDDTLAILWWSLAGVALAVPRAS